MIAPVAVVTAGRRWRSYSVLAAALLVFGKKLRRPLFEKLYERFSVWPRSILLLVRSVRNHTVFSLDTAAWSIASSSWYDVSIAPVCERGLSIA